MIIENSGATLSVKEAALLAGVTEKVVRHELAAGVVRPVRKRRGHVSLDAHVVFFLKLIASLPVEVPSAERRSLAELLKTGERAHGHWRREPHRLVLGGAVPILVDIDELERAVVERVNLFLRGMRRVVRSIDILGGTPVFAGTRVSIEHVGLLVQRGVPMTELREDFPRLSGEDFEFARLFVQLGKPRGRPRKLKFIRG